MMTEAMVNEANRVFANTTGFHILLVDDSRTFQKFFSAPLKALGHVVSTAASGPEALALFCPATADVVIADYEMPDMNGLQLLDAIHAKSSVTPVIVLTGHEDITLAVRVMRTGAIDFLTKSHASQELPGALQRAAAFVQQQRELKREVFARREAELSLENFNENLSKDVCARTSEMMEKEARIHAVIQSAVDGIVTIDPSGRIESFNPAAEKMFGHTSEEAIGSNINTLMPSPYKDDHDSHLARYMSTGEKSIIGSIREVSGRRKDGTVFSQELSVVEVKNGNTRLFTGIVRDITERKEAEKFALQTREARISQEQAERTNTAKSEFLANMSHEIRTLMTAILGFADELRVSLKQQEQLEAIDIIKKNGGYLATAARLFHVPRGKEARAKQHIAYGDLRRQVSVRQDAGAVLADTEVSPRPTVLQAAGGP